MFPGARGIDPARTVVVGTIRPRSLFALGIVLLTLAIVSPTPIDPTVRASSPPVVLLVGDSLMLGAQSHGDLSARLRRAGVVPVVVARNGLSTGRSAPVIQQARRKQRIDLVVVALGTNDAMVGHVGAAFGRSLADVLAVTGRVPVLWVDVHATAFARDARSVNAQLKKAARRSSTMRLLTWSEAPGADSLIYDGVHLTPRGYRLRAKFIIDAVKDALPRTGS